MPVPDRHAPTWWIGNCSNLPVEWMVVPGLFPKRLIWKLAISAAVLAASLAVVVPFVVLRLWATPQWIEANLVPILERQIGRDIAFRDVSFGLQGIALEGFSLGEDPDFTRKGNEDFFSADRIHVKLDLSGLFVGKIVIDEIRADGAVLVVHKGKIGYANYRSLVDWPAMPLRTSGEHGVVIERIDVTNGKLVYLDEDRNNGIPLELVASNVDASVTRMLPGKPFDVHLSATVKLAEGKPIHVRSIATYDPSDGSVRIDGDLDRVNVLEIVHGLDPQPKPRSPRTRELPALAWNHPPIRAHLRVERVETLKSVFYGVRCDAEMVDRRIRVDSLSATLADGSLWMTGSVDLTRAGLAYAGKLRVDRADAPRLLAPILPANFGRMSGELTFDARFSGAGTLASSFFDHIAADGEVRATQGRLTGTPLLAEIARLTGMRVFRDLEVRDSGGRLVVAHRKLQTDKMTLGGPKGRLIFLGELGFDGSLNTQMWAGIYPDGQRQLFSTGILLPYVKDRDGWTYIPIVLSGNYRHPDSAIAPGAVTETAINLIPDVTEKLLKTSAKTTGKILKTGADALGALFEGIDRAVKSVGRETPASNSPGAGGSAESSR